MTVNDDPAGVERLLAAGELRCPGCADRLAGWGWARPRVLRAQAGRWRVRPRRARCVGCAVTHVLLPVGVLARRADTVGVVAGALAAKAAGLGARAVAVLVGRPFGTVKGWLRRFAGRAEQVRAWFTGLLVAGGAGSVGSGPGGFAGGGRGGGDRGRWAGGRGPVRGAHGDAVASGRRGLGWPVVVAGLATGDDQHEFTLVNALCEREPSAFVDLLVTDGEEAVVDDRG